MGDSMNGIYESCLGVFGQSLWIQEEAVLAIMDEFYFDNNKSIVIQSNPTPNII